MLAETFSSSERAGLEDPLSYLPCSAIAEYRKGQVIYETDQTLRDLCLVIEGAVKVSRAAGQGEIVIDIRQTDEFFGESALVGAQGERAIALQKTKLMSWPADTVRELIQKNPKLGVALTQLLANRCRDLAERVATLSADSTARRLAKALFEFSFRMGQPDPEAREARRLPPLSHKLLAQYIGTRREAVTHCMNRFRREGLVSYSRRGLVVYTKELQEWLNLPSPVEESTPEATMPPGGPEQHHWNDSASI